MKIIAHTMEYKGSEIESTLELRNYIESDYEEYKRVYEDCFFKMRTALELKPVRCCGRAENLLRKSEKIFILEEQNHLIGSVAIYDNEIDDLVVAKEYQCKGYGRKLLQFAVSYMQKKGISPIRLHVADWNQNAVKMYLNNGFEITKTETVK